MRILMALTYYRPHISGLTLYAQRLAEALVSRGHEVTVLTSRHDPRLPAQSTEAGVSVHRANPLLRVSKGIISPALYWQAARLIKAHDILLLHLPQFDSPGLAMLARASGVPVILTYQCDLQLSPGRLNRLVTGTLRLMHEFAAWMAQRIVASTGDFADNSPLLKRHREKCTVISPPVMLPAIDGAARERFRATHNPLGRPLIGMATRLAAEKGVEILLDALPQVLRQFPDAKVVFCGQYRQVWGEQDYYARLEPLITRFQRTGHFEFLGVVDQQDLVAFYANLNVLVVPSLNSTEAFGLVQIEAMQNGCPVIASDLPGVRQPVAMTGLGRVIPAGDAAALAEAITDIIRQPPEPPEGLAATLAQFHPDSCARAYEEVFAEAITGAGT